MFTSIMQLSMDNPSFSTVLLVLLLALSFGVGLMAIYIYTHRITGYEKSFAMTLMILPIVISLIIMLVSNNIARAFSLAGIFTLVKFRNTIENPRDITFIFITVGLGLSMGTGAVGYGLIFFGIIIIVLLLMNYLKMDIDGFNKMKLKIIVPENLNYQNTFDSIFNKHLINYRLIKVKTTDFGTVFELSYLVKSKKDFNQKKFFDEIRTKNGNLDIMMTSYYQESN